MSRATAYTRARRVLSLALLAVASACTAEMAAEEPIWGKQPCGHCAMLVSDRAHGAQLVDTRGERLFFDDVGCMVAWEREHPQRMARHWVRRGDAQDWVAPEETGFQGGVRSPMDFGFQAVAAGGQASWGDVVTAVAADLDRLERR